MFKALFHPIVWEWFSEKFNTPTVAQGSDIVASANPLNLVGILTPGSRVSPLSGQAIVYCNGVPGDVRPLGGVRSRFYQTRTGATRED